MGHPPSQRCDDGYRGRVVSRPLFLCSVQYDRDARAHRRGSHYSRSTFLPAIMSCDPGGTGSKQGRLPTRQNLSIGRYEQAPCGTRLISPHPRELARSCGERGREGESSRLRSLPLGFSRTRACACAYPRITHKKLCKMADKNARKILTRHQNGSIMKKTPKLKGE